ncbi:MAG: hypothetical protein R2769_11150 [Saprospiraceae bacterium]
MDFENFFSDIKIQVGTYYDNLVVLFPKLVLGLTILILFFLLSRILKSYSNKRLQVRMDDPLLAKFISNIIGTATIILAILIFLQVIGLGEVSIGLLSTAGVGAFILGFAFKDIGENFLAVLY